MLENEVTLRLEIRRSLSFSLRGPLCAGEAFLSPTAPAEGGRRTARRGAPVVHSATLRSLHPTYRGYAADYVVGLRPSGELFELIAYFKEEMFMDIVDPHARKTT